MTEMTERQTTIRIRDGDEGGQENQEQQDAQSGIVISFTFCKAGAGLLESIDSALLGKQHKIPGRELFFVPTM